MLRQEARRLSVRHETTVPIIAALASPAAARERRPAARMAAQAGRRCPDSRSPGYRRSRPGDREAAGGGRPRRSAPRRCRAMSRIAPSMLRSRGPNALRLDRAASSATDLLVAPARRMTVPFTSIALPRSRLARGAGPLLRPTPARRWPASAGAARPRRRPAMDDARISGDARRTASRSGSPQAGWVELQTRRSDHRGGRWRSMRPLGRDSGPRRRDRCSFRPGRPALRCSISTRAGLAAAMIVLDLSHLERGSAATLARQAVPIRRLRRALPETGFLSAPRPC